MTIRTANPADAAAITAIYAPIVQATSISFEMDPPSVERASSVGGINQWDYHVIPYKVAAVEKLPLQNAFKINYVCALA